MDGVENGGGSEGHDIFDLLRGGGGGRQKRQTQQKMRPRKVACEVTLEDCYNGKLTKVKVSR